MPKFSMTLLPLSSLLTVPKKAGTYLTICIVGKAKVRGAE